MNSVISLSDRREVLILNLDTFAAKNVSQIRLMEAEGYGFTVVTNDIRGASRRVFDAQDFRRSRLIVLGGLRNKVVTVFSMLLRERFHHVEFYPAGRLALLYLLLIKLFAHRLVVIERGDVGALGYYDWLTRLNLKLAYRLADRVIYKETYMEEPLRSLTRAPLAFLPNCVERRPAENHGKRGIDFLWANRVIPQRRPEWIAEAMADARLADRSLVMLGIEPDTALATHLPESQRRLRTLAAPNVTIEGFIDPEPYYGQARFFCLPATIVFGNNALLEALASGVVPIVTEAPGVGRIVEDGVNGFCTPFEEEAYREAMVRAAALSDEEWRAMSRRAVETVRTKYSAEAWARKMADVYAHMGAA